MSAAGRGAERRRDDYYPTPAWAVHRFLEAVELPEGLYLEPCAGDGAIVRAASAAPAWSWVTMDIRPRAESVYRGDFLLGELPTHRPFACCLTNPPYLLALPFIEQARKVAHVVAMLLRLGFLGGGRRAWHHANPADVYILPNRPSYTGDGRSDASEYAWFVWGLTEGGHHYQLEETPIEQRRAA